MSILYVAVAIDYFNNNPWPRGTQNANEAMSYIWRVFDVTFLRNNHPLGDLYSLRFESDEDATAFVLRNKVGTVVNFEDKVEWYR